MKVFLLCLLSVRAYAGSDDDMGRRVQALLQAHQAEVFGCVQSSQAQTDGEILLRVMVGDSDLPAQVDVLEDKSGSTGLASCLQKRARAWNLSSLGVSAGDQVVFPLAFRPTPAATTLSALRLAANRELTVAHDGQLALLVVSGGVKVNGKVLGPEDLVWLAKGQPCRIETVGAALLARMESSLPAPLGKAASLPAADKPMRIVRGRDKKAVTIPGGSVRVYLSDVGVAVDLLRLNAGAVVPTHSHAGSDELLFIVSGSATTTIDGVAQPTRTGDQIRIASGKTHAVQIEAPLVAVQVYSPAGPEQRFLQTPKDSP